MPQNLSEIVDHHLSHRNPADRLCRDQLVAAIEEKVIAPIMAAYEQSLAENKDYHEQALEEINRLRSLVPGPDTLLIDGDWLEQEIQAVWRMEISPKEFLQSIRAPWYEVPLDHPYDWWMDSYGHMHILGRHDVSDLPLFMETVLDQYRREDDGSLD